MQCYNKIITKIPTNRFKLILLPKLVGATQSSFAPWEVNNDNIVVVQKLIHTIRRKEGYKGGLILKVDLDKGYDRIDWGFLESVLPCTGFNHSFQRLILKCITSETLSVCWNGGNLEAFSPSRGLQQGDPLSLYLFVMCMETLNPQI